MRVLLSVEHPAWVHQYRHIIERLRSAGNEVLIVAIDKDGVCELLEKFGLPFILTARTTGQGALQKAWLLLSLTYKYWRAGRKFRAELLIGRATPMMAITAFLLRKKHIIFEDTEHSHISLFFCRLFSTTIVTPRSFRRDLGRKQIRKPIYKESFYLHPQRFVPDDTVLRDLALSANEPFVLIRLVSWRADHDFGKSGLALETKKRLVAELSKLGKVFISSELPLDPHFRPYQLHLPREKIHSLMYHASLIYGESSTMASEAAVLGTHAIFCDFEGRGYTDEQEQRFQLVYNFRLDPESQSKSIEKAIELLSNPQLKRLGKEKRERMLQEIADGTDCMYEILRTVGGVQ